MKHVKQLSRRPSLSPIQQSKTVRAAWNRQLLFITAGLLLRGFLNFLSQHLLRSSLVTRQRTLCKPTDTCTWIELHLYTYKNTNQLFKVSFLNTHAQWVCFVLIQTSACACEPLLRFDYSVHILHTTLSKDIKLRKTEKPLCLIRYI